MHKAAPWNTRSVLRNGTSISTYGHWEINGTLVNSVILAGFALAWIFLTYSQCRESGLFYIPLVCGFIILILARS